MKTKNSFFFIWCVLAIQTALGRRWKKSVEGGYIFTAPRSLKIGSDNELQLIREGDLSEGVFTVRVYYSESYHGNQTLALQKEFEIENGKNNSFFQLFIKPFDSKYVYNGKLEINGTYGGKTFGGSDKVYFSTPKSNIVVIQTDKSLYKPGQTVRFRVLKVNKDLKPSDDPNDLADVFIEDTKGTRLFQFKDVQLGSGIRQMEFPLSDEPVLGSWKISVQGKNDSTSVNFEVKEYVLPKFDVKIKFPPFVLANAVQVPIEVCAKYTYGKNVVGTLNLNASVETYSWSNDKHPVLQESVKIDGCYKYTINISLIEPDSIYRYRRIMVVANIIETGTNVQRNVTEYLQRQYSPLNLMFADQDGRDYFKPGLPYRGKLQVNHPDESPASEEPIEICATVSRERVIENWFGTRKVKVCKNYTSDEKGEIKFTLPPQNTDCVSIVLNAKSLKYARDSTSSSRDQILNQPETSESLSPYFSPSGNFMQLESIGKSLPCGQLQNISLLFTSKENGNFRFQYQIIHLSTTVQSEVVETSFTKETDDVSSLLEDSDDVIKGVETQVVPALVKGRPSNSTHECEGTKEARYVPPIGRINIPINIDANLSPTFTLLVFYTRPDKEVIADSRKFDVQKCFKNLVGIEFGDKVKQPATKTSVRVKASPNSLCGLKIVDKSVSLLDAGDQLSKKRVFELIKNLDSNIYYSQNPCYENKPQPGLYASRSSMIRPPIPPIYSGSSYQDSLVAFQDSGLLIISDLLLFTRPCSNQGYGSGGGYGGVAAFQTEDAAGAPQHAVALASTARRPAPVSADAKIGAAPTKSAVEVRNYFPETWLFDMEMTGPEGEYISKEKLPHTITEWVGSAVCINSEDGLGLSDETSIKGFQAFFISYTLPVSVVRGEEFWVVVSIFNYADGSLPISVSLDNPEGFEVTSDSINGDICVQPSLSENLRLKLKATKVGNLNITVRAETTSSDSVCSGSGISDAVAKDAITQSLEVEAEGYPTETVTSTLFCPTDLENQVFSSNQELSLPEDVVPDSSRALVDVTGNVLGPAIKNLDNLVTLPTGCGEQNMVKFTPNYLVLDYLTFIGQLNDKIKSQAIRNLNKGYQRELTFLRKDGSFSAFGNVDKEGSMFLTAFVLKSFAEAEKYITIDKNILVKSQNWISSKQLAGGCFPNVGKIIDYGLKGGLEKEKDNSAITAYVLTALLTSEFENETVINKAFECIANNDAITPYETFLYAYAEALGGKNEAAQARINSIEQRSNTTDGVKYYRNPNGTKALDLETAAYAVLANLKLGSDASVALPLVRYMTKNLNPRGGFFSTQDTCVGLDALSQFAKLVYKDPVNILVELSGSLNEKVEVTEENKLLVQRQLISNISNGLNVQASGSGCGLIQTSLRYNTKSPPESQNFHLEVALICTTRDCQQEQFFINVRYVPEGKAAGMSVVEIKLLSGVSPVKESLEKLVANKEANKVLRFDVENNKVIFYLSEVNNKGSQFSFDAERVVEVENPQPGTAKVFDYYTPENSKSTSYTLTTGPANDSGSEKVSSVENDTTDL